MQVWIYLQQLEALLVLKDEISSNSTHIVVGTAGIPLWKIVKNPASSIFGTTAMLFFFSKGLATIESEFMFLQFW